MNGHTVDTHNRRPAARTGGSTRIGIVGAGMIGQTVARLLATAGHDVALTNRTCGDRLEQIAAELGPRVRAVRPAEALEFGPMVVLALPFGAVRWLPPDAMAGRLVVDATNYRPDRDGSIPELDDESTTSSELVAEHFRDATVVKAFNTMYYVYLDARGDTGAEPRNRPVLFVAGDDDRAKNVVRALINASGFAAVDSGDLVTGGRRQQPGHPLYGTLLYGRDVEGVFAF